MKKLFRSSIYSIVFFVLCSCVALAQNVPQAVLIKIVRAEDELRFDRDLQDLLKSPNAKIRLRATLAAGRIGSETAIPILSEMLDKDVNNDVRAMAAFALGETESSKAADTILKVFAKKDETDAVRARALEAAGKIAAANPKDEKSKELGESVLDTLEAEQLIAIRNKEVVLLGLTAALRAKPDEADFVVGKFLTDKDASIRADALNTLVRLKSKNENLKAQYRAMLLSDDAAIVRANAARALGASEDALSLDLLIEAAITDDDQRVRVAAIRSLGNLNNKKAAVPLLERGEKLLAIYKTAKTKFANPAEKNELLEIATTLGRLLPNSNDERAVKFLRDFRSLEKSHSPEIEVALARVSPNSYLNGESLISINYDAQKKKLNADWQAISSVAQGLGEIANLEPSEANQKMRARAETALRGIVGNPFGFEDYEKTLARAMPDVIRALAAFKSNDSAVILREQLNAKDVIIRATAAELLGEQTASTENIEALKMAFAQAVKNDIEANDATLMILNVLAKLDKKEASESLQSALYSKDFLVRRQAAVLIRQNGLEKDFPKLNEQASTVKFISAGKVGLLGMIINNQSDYVSAISRKNETTKAILTTEKGTFTINLLPEDAPLTVENFVHLAKSGYFNGIAFHRVVPNFVIQGGDPRGDGNGGPGWQIRCEINMIPFDRGAVGMALSGKDTGGSQWFVTHSPQPHLDGGYTVFGRVNEAEMKIVDNIARGDKILSVRIIENVARQGAKTQRKKK
ncbi:MAG: peptidylprolyl isomerase [Pyrinomonadaceae bacterium]